MGTEIATGPEARSLRRWLRRVVAPAVVRSLVLLLLVVVAVTAYGLVAELVFTDSVCKAAFPFDCNPPDPPPGPHWWDELF